MNIHSSTFKRGEPTTFFKTQVVLCEIMRPTNNFLIEEGSSFSSLQELTCRRMSNCFCCYDLNDNPHAIYRCLSYKGFEGLITPPPATWGAKTWHQAVRFKWFKWTDHILYPVYVAPSPLQIFKDHLPFWSQGSLEAERELSVLQDAGRSSRSHKLS